LDQLEIWQSHHQLIFLVSFDRTVFAVWIWHR